MLINLNMFVTDLHGVTKAIGDVRKSIQS